MKKSGKNSNKRAGKSDADEAGQTVSAHVILPDRDGEDIFRRAAVYFGAVSENDYAIYMHLVNRWQKGYLKNKGPVDKAEASLLKGLNVQGDAIRANFMH